MVNPKRSGSRPTPTEPDRDRGRSSNASEAGSGFRLADTLAAVMLLLATLTYLGRLMLGLSQPGDTIAPRDFGSLLAAIIAIVAGILLVTGVKPPVGRLTGALGAGALLLFNVANLTGGAVDDVLGKTDRWAAIPVVATTFLAIVALLQASWSSVGARADRDAYEESDDSAPAQRTAQAPERTAAPERSAPETLGVIGAPDPAADEPDVPWRQTEDSEPPLSPPVPSWRTEDYAEPPLSNPEPRRQTDEYPEPQVSQPLSRGQVDEYAEPPLLQPTPRRQVDDYAESPLSQPALRRQVDDYAEPPLSQPAPRRQADDYTESPLSQMHQGSFAEARRPWDEPSGSYAQAGRRARSARSPRWTV